MKMINKIAAPIFLALASVAIYAGSEAQSNRLLLSGPVESVDNATNTVSVLGHRFVLKNTASILPGHSFAATTPIAGSKPSSRALAVAPTRREPGLCRLESIYSRYTRASGDWGHRPRTPVVYVSPASSGHAAKIY